MKYAAEMASGGIIYISSFMKICSINIKVLSQQYKRL
jgi:hypothetical protein